MGSMSATTLARMSGAQTSCTCLKGQSSDLFECRKPFVGWLGRPSKAHQKQLGTGLQRKKDVLRAAKVEESDLSPQDGTSAGASSDDDMAARLAKAEAEAAALRRELEARKAVSSEKDVGKPKAGNKRIDGTGLRETLWEGPGARKERENFTKSVKSSKWGLSEAELFISRGAGEGEFEAIVGPAEEDGSANIVRRNLIIGVGLALVAGTLAVVRFPAGRPKPAKPLFFYLVPLVRIQGLFPDLQRALENGELADLREQLKIIVGEPNNLKDSLLNAASWLPTDAELDAANRVVFDVLEYVDQADFKKYYDNFGDPSPSQRAEFIKFSTQSIKAASRKLEEFLRLMPGEDVAAAREQVARSSLPEEQLTL